MPEEKILMHGSMFFLMKEFIVSNYGNETWMELTKKTGVDSLYDIHKNYPASEMFLIIKAVTDHTGLSESIIKEKLGAHLVPMLLTMYKAHIRPEWKTFEMLENTELVMHKAVRKQENEAKPPILNVSRVHDKLLIIDYYSKRKMASLAIGIIKGIAEFYNESEKINVVPMCDQDDERVQIRIEFK
jgi:hypothetical protein